MKKWNSNRKLSHLLVLVLMHLFSTISFAQTDNDPPDDGGFNAYPNIIPPSPTASNLGAIGDVGVDLNSGTPSLSIPIYNLQGKNLEIPIALNYSSSGIKVDEVGSWVGIGWNLKAGGVIKRNIRDEDDEIGHGNGRDNYCIPENLDLNPETIRFVEETSNADNGLDTEPDIFTFSFNNNSGKFIISPHGIVTIPYQNIKIEMEVDGYDFKITTADGVSYFFGGTGAVGISRFDNTCNNHAGYEFSETEWFLKKIIHPLGDEVDFIYKTTGYNYYSGMQQTAKKLHACQYCPPGVAGGCGSGVTSMEEPCFSKIFVSSSYVLTSIEYVGVGKLEFESSKGADVRKDLNDYRLDKIYVKHGSDTLKEFAFDYHQPLCMGAETKLPSPPDNVKYRMFLKSITESSRINKIPPYMFEYEDINYFSDECNLSQRLSFDQDHWGYYNGAGNVDFLPPYDVFEFHADKEPNNFYARKGLLTKINYPTGGYKIIDYEANKTWGNVTVWPTSLHEHCEEIDGYNFGHQDFYFDIAVEQFRDCEITLSTCDRPPGDNGDECHGFGELIRPDGSLVISLNSDGRRILDNDQYDLPAGTYRMHLEGSNFSKESNYFHVSMCFYYDDAEPYSVETEIPHGGSRVARITTLEDPDQSPVIKKYYYNTQENKDITSAKNLFQPEYHNILYTKAVCGDGNEVGCYYQILHSNNQTPLSLTSPSLSYEYVTESFGENFENGGVTHTFEVSSDTRGITIWGSELLGVPFSNTGWNNGRKIKEETFEIHNGEKVILTEKNYIYNDEASNEVITKGVVVRKNYSPTLSINASYTCTEDDCGMVLYYTKCLANHLHDWNIPYGYDKNKRFGFYGVLRDYYWGAKPQMKIYCHAAGAENVLVAEPHPCVELNPGDIITNLASLDPYDVYEYEIISKWSYLNEIVSTQYDRNGENPIITKKSMFYDNPKHNLLTSENESNNIGENIKSKYKYALDYDIYADCEIAYEQCIDNYETNLKNCIIACNGDENCESNCMQTLNDVYDQCIENLENCTDEVIIDVQVKAIAHMQEKFINTPPIETIQTYQETTGSDEKLTGGQISLFEIDGYGNLQKSKLLQLMIEGINIDEYTESTISNFDFAYDELRFFEALSFKKYDEYGNLQQYQRPGGINTVILYGYNYQLPVAKIDNANYDEVIDALTAIGESEESINTKSLLTNDETELQNLFENLRNHMQSSQVTSITYNPLIGVTSQTSASGMITTYNYDDLGRLKIIKDEDGNITQSYEYNYFVNTLMEGEYDFNYEILSGFSLKFDVVGTDCQNNAFNYKWSSNGISFSSSTNCQVINTFAGPDIYEVKLDIYYKGAFITSVTKDVNLDLVVTIYGDGNSIVECETRDYTASVYPDQICDYIWSWKPISSSTWQSIGSNSNTLSNIGILSTEGFDIKCEANNGYITDEFIKTINHTPFNFDFSTGDITANASDNPNTGEFTASFTFNNTMCPYSFQWTLYSLDNPNFDPIYFNSNNIVSNYPVDGEAYKLKLEVTIDGVTKSKIWTFIGH